MTNAEKFKEVFGRDLEESRMLSMPSSFNQIIALKSFQIEGVDCADEWKESKYQGEPTIPLSVIEKIKTYIHKEVMFRDLWHGEKDLMDYIDKVVKESTEDFDARLKQYLVENDLRIIPNGEWKDLNSKWKECLGDIRDIKTRINALEPSSTKSRPEPIKGYICDPKKNKECAKTACYERGGLCCLTLNPEYARENAPSPAIEIEQTVRRKSE